MSLNKLLTFCVALVVYQMTSISCHADISCQRRLAEQAYQEILKATAGSSLVHADFDSIENNLVLLGSIEDKEAFKRLIDLVDIYIGEGTSEMLGQIIVEKGKAILPVIKAALSRSSTCEAKKHTCRLERNGALREFVTVIKSGETYGSGDSIPYLSAADLGKECVKLNAAEGKK